MARYEQMRLQTGTILLATAGILSATCVARWLRRRYSKQQRILRRVKAAPGSRPIIGHFQPSLVCCTRITELMARGKRTHAAIPVKGDVVGPTAL